MNSSSNNGGMSANAGVGRQDCGCHGVLLQSAQRGIVRRIALDYVKKTGNAVVFYKCSEWNFALLADFIPDGKSNIEYILQ
jgi:hypothetical protein